MPTGLVPRRLGSALLTLLVSAAVVAPARAQAPQAEQTVLAVDAFMAGAPLTAAETAVIVAEDAGDRRANPALVLKNDRAAAALMTRVRRSPPQLQAQQRQQLMNGLFAAPSGFADPRQKAIIAHHNPVLAISSASREALTLRSVAGLIDQMRQMAAFEGRPPLDEAAIKRLAAELPADFKTSSATSQRYMAFGESDSLALRRILARLTAAQHARYRQAAGGAQASPQVLWQDALKLLLADARGRRAPSNGSVNGLLRETERMAFSPFLPH